MSELKNRLLAAGFVAHQGELYTVRDDGDGVILTDPCADDPSAETGLTEVPLGAELLAVFQPVPDEPEVWRDATGEQSIAALRLIAVNPDEQPRRLRVDTLSDEDCYGVPTSALVLLTPAQRARIRQLAQAVAELDCFCVEEFNYAPDWFGTDDTRIDTCRLVVTREDFWWEGMLKHTSVAIQTDRTAVADLNA